MCRVQVWSDLETGVYVIGRVRAKASDGRIDAQGAVVAAQAGQCDAVRSGGHRGVERGAAVHGEGTSGCLMVPQRRDLCRIRVVRGMAR